MGRCLFMRKGESHTNPGQRLPSGYTELAFIQSSGTQYIDTNFIPNHNSRVVADFQITASNAWQAVFGAWGYTTTYVNSFVFLATSSNVFRSDYGGISSTFSNSVSINARHTIDHNKKTVTLDSATITHSHSSFTAPCKLNIFAGNTDGATSEFANMKLYSCQIYDNDVLVRDFVPCIKDDGTIGLYDLVGKQFYGNAGTGVFTGSEVA